MSQVLSSKEGVRARKDHQCAFCFEIIFAGDLHDTRNGVEPGEGFWTMRMHPECHQYEQHGTREGWDGRKEKVVDMDWYEDASDEAFPRCEAIAFQRKQPVTV